MNTGAIIFKSNEACNGSVFCKSEKNRHDSTKNVNGSDQQEGRKRAGISKSDHCDREDEGSGGAARSGEPGGSGGMVGK